MNRFIAAPLLLLILALTILAYPHYRGEGYVFLYFSLVSNALLFLGFRKKAIYFDAFIGVFFWLGFWLKLTLRVAFTDSQFHESTGAFDGSGAAFDHALYVSSCGMLGLVCATLTRQKFFSYSEQSANLTNQGLYWWYKRHRTALVTAFLAVTVAVALSNAVFGFYQRGAITQTTLPFRLNGIYAWLLQFGLASASALIIRFEIERSGNISWLASSLTLIEGFLSNVSLLSRGMVLNVSALFFGTITLLTKKQIKPNRQVAGATALAFIALFIMSVSAVNVMRSSHWQSFLNTLLGKEVATQWEKAGTEVIKASTPLFVDRWVGMEGVMAVSSSPKIGWELWQAALHESYNERKTSFYDENLSQSPYTKLDHDKYHFISMPGVVAFCYYPGSYPMLFMCLFGFGIFAAVLESVVFRLGGANLILCSLMAEVIAYRYASFGYVPRQSYLLFGTLIANVLIIYCANRILMMSMLRSARE